MSLSFTDRIMDLYSEWLMDTYPDEVSCKDKLIELCERGHRIEEFKQKIIEEL